MAADAPRAVSPPCQKWRWKALPFRRPRRRAAPVSPLRRWKAVAPPILNEREPSSEAGWPSGTATLWSSSWMRCLDAAQPSCHRANGSVASEPPPARVGKWRPRCSAARAWRASPPALKRSRAMPAPT